MNTKSNKQENYTKNKTEIFRCKNDEINVTQALIGLTEIDGHEIDGHDNDGHEIGGQDIYRLKIDYITMQCAILFKTTAEYK